MGKGLALQKEGTHIAFAAGTGILVFIDLVAFLLRRATGKLGKGEKDLVGPNFKFILYASFPSVEESIGLDLLRGAESICRSLTPDSFEVHLRISGV